MTISEPAPGERGQGVRWPDPLAPLPSSREWTGPAEGQGLYQAYSTEQDKAHTNVHYEQPPAFFYAVTGGEWNVYSANLWSEGVETDTQSQEAKLDLLAQHMELKPGLRILDVGCGWAGPLTYLCKTYGVEGVGLTLSPTQKRCAEERIARHGLQRRVQVLECHWRDFEDPDRRGFDALYTDEVIVHFNDLGGFFQKAHALLKPGGRMLNKELHFTHSSLKTLTRAATLISEIYGLTGNYRTLADELALMDQAGFRQSVWQMPLWHYTRTADRWLDNMWEHKDQLEVLVGPEYYRRFRAYLKIVRRMTTLDTMTLDIVVGKKPR